MVKNTVFIALLLIICSCDSKQNSINKTEIVDKNHTQNIQNKGGLPIRVGVVNDFEGNFTKTERIELTNIINQHRNFNGNQLVLVTVTNIGKYPNFETFSYTLANTWGAGEKDKNNGVMLIFSRRLGQLRIERGTGLTHKLTQKDADRIMLEIMVPFFNKNDFFGGAKAGLKAIVYELSKIDASQGTPRPQ